MDDGTLNTDRLQSDVDVVVGFSKTRLSSSSTTTTEINGRSTEDDGADSRLLAAQKTVVVVPKVPDWLPAAGRTAWTPTARYRQRYRRTREGEPNRLNRRCAVEEVNNRVTVSAGSSGQSGTSAVNWWRQRRRRRVVLPPLPVSLIVERILLGMTMNCLAMRLGLFPSALAAASGGSSGGTDNLSQQLFLQQQQQQIQQHLLQRQESLQDYCGYERFIIRCQSNQVISIRRALYGRMQPGRCITGEYGHVMGCFADVTPYVSELCDLRQNCSMLVATMDSVAQPCAKDFKSYLQASHVCVNVSYSDDCRNDDVTVVTETYGYLAIVPRSLTVSNWDDLVSATTCDWTISTDPGRSIVLSWVRQLTNAGVDIWQLLTNAANADSCPVSLRFRERSQTVPEATLIPACRGRDITGPVYTSTGNQLTLSVAFSRSRGPFTSSSAWKLVSSWMLEFAVYGCTDMDPPVYTTVRRVGDDAAAIFCNRTGETWYVTCRDGVWTGTVGNCSKFEPRALNVTAMERPVAVQTGNSLEARKGAMIAVVVGVAIGMLTGSLLLFAIVLIKNSCRSPAGTSDVINSGSCMEESLYLEHVSPAHRGWYPSLLDDASVGLKRLEVESQPPGNDPNYFRGYRYQGDEQSSTVLRPSFLLPVKHFDCGACAAHGNVNCASMTSSRTCGPYGTISATDTLGRTNRDSLVSTTSFRPEVSTRLLQTASNTAATTVHGPVVDLTDYTCQGYSV